MAVRSTLFYVARRSRYVLRLPVFCTFVLTVSAAAAHPTQTDVSVHMRGQGYNPDSVEICSRRKMSFAAAKVNLQASYQTVSLVCAFRGEVVEFAPARRSVDSQRCFLAVSHRNGVVCEPKWRLLRSCRSPRCPQFAFEASYANGTKLRNLSAYHARLLHPVLAESKGWSPV